MDGVLRDVQHAFYRLCVNAGKQVLAAMMEADRVALCGAKGVPDAGRRAARGGLTAGAVVLGGQRIGIKRPRARSIDKGELRLATYEWAAQRDSLDAATLAAVAAGVSTRRYAGTLDELPPPEEALSVSESAVSRRFVALSQEQLHQWLWRSLKNIDLPVATDRRHPLPRPRHPGGTRHRRQGQQLCPGAARGLHREHPLVRSLLSDLIERGLDADRTRLWVIDGGKALRRAIVECFGALALVQRCQEHKRRNVIEHLPEELHAGLGRAMRDAWGGANAELAKKQLQRLATSLQAKHPGAAAILREGLDETLTVQGLGITDALYRTLSTTNPIENLNGSIGHYTRNVKRWKDGPMTLRWVASALSVCHRAVQKAARASRHEDLDCCIGFSRCQDRQRRTQAA